ncbi:MAG: hypothetical protein A3C53_03155 [Omnitrophica WOR_2 bacterium RIFCSPHIGHO2_02_FULL_68_15]|nr:MAG: hypothetical protein A3C53_03155 [Omnitrophica WOR_2 bacterium RIFCSPHIGHO2_02_FULL_68_15]
MLEALVSSRIRRALFEHILTRPSERFYLRGLAKSLGLSVSPLRRELKRLERSDVLRAAQEGNMLFYTVNTDAAAFLQLQQAGLQTKAPSPSDAEQPFGVQGSGFRAAAISVAQNPQPPTPNQALISLHSPLPTGALIGAAGVGAALLVVVASLLYIRLTNRQLRSEASRALATRKTEMVMTPREASSGVMRGNRWQISPGGFGGFSSGAANSGSFSR